MNSLSIYNNIFNNRSPNIIIRLNIYALRMPTCSLYNFINRDVIVISSQTDSTLSEVQGNDRFLFIFQQVFFVCQKYANVYIIGTSQN